MHFLQIALAIKYLHFKKICHRDLKPENVLLCSLDELLPIVKIKEMGMSRLVDNTRLSQRSNAMPLRGLEPLSALTEISCLPFPQRHMGFFNVLQSTSGTCLVWEV